MSAVIEALKGKLPPVCEKHGVAVVYLFGSHAEGVAMEGSDVDLGVVFFEPPSDEDWWERWHRLADDLEPLVPSHELDIILLQRAPVLLQWQAISKGKVLYCADEESRLKFEERVIGEWLDFSEWLEGFWREMVAGIREEGRRDARS